MIYREAQKDDIKQLMEVRLALKENTLSNPSLVTEADYYNYLFNRSKGWVCMVQDRVAGFSIVDREKCLGIVCSSGFCSKRDRKKIT